MRSLKIAALGICAIIGAFAAACNQPPPQITISGDINVVEGETATITLNLNEPLRRPLTVNLATTIRTDASPIDYRFNNIVVIEAGASEAAVSVTLVDDNEVETQEFLVIEIAPSEDYEIVQNRDSILTIEDNDTLPVITISDDATVDENGAITLTIRADQTLTSPLDISVAALENSTATLLDYNYNGSIRLLAGADSASFVITIIDDEIVEGDEFAVFEIAPSGSGAYELGENRAAIVTIADNDTLPVVSISDDVTVREGRDIRLTVTADRLLTTPLTVQLSASLNSSATPADYRFDSSIVIPAGQNRALVTVRTTDDDVFEGDEFATLAIERSASFEIGGDGVATVNIRDDDRQTFSATEIHDMISPSVAFVQSSSGSGSGLLIDNGNILTAWHVTDPHASVRIVFGNGEQHLNVPVRAVDPYRDLAIVGPIDTDIPPFTDFGSGDIESGDTVFLIGYPAEFEDFPVPAITQGIVSRPREWDGADLTILQVDADIRGGQSGGVLVSDLGQVVGISNYSFSDNTGLINEISDLAEFIEDLERGRNPDGIGNRILLSEFGGSIAYRDLQIANFRDQHAFIIRPSAGDSVALAVLNGSTTLSMEVIEVNRSSTVFASESPYGRNPSTSFTASRGGVYLVTIKSAEFVGEHSFDFVSSHTATRVQIDADDGRRLSVGNSRIGNLDFPTDIDYFLLDLEAGRTVDICVDSFVFDAVLLFDTLDDFRENDNSGGGFSNRNPKVTVTASETRTYLVAVIGAFVRDVGGYEIAVGSRCDDF